MVLRVERSRHSKPTVGRLTAAVPLAGAGRLVAALACAALAAGCSSSSSSSSPPAPSQVATSASAAASASSSSTAAAGPPACATSALKVTQSAPNGYAGGFDVTIGFTNTSTAACTLYGYPGVSLVSASRTQIGLPATRLSTVPVKLVTLASGATASALVQIAERGQLPEPHLRLGQSRLPADLPAEPDRPGLPGQHVPDLRQAGPDPHGHRGPGRLGQFLVTASLSDAPMPCQGIRVAFSWSHSWGSEGW